MPNVRVAIAGHEFEFSCSAEEIEATHAAARVLDAEIGKIMEKSPSAPMHQQLMAAAVVLADKVASLSEEVEFVRGRLSELEDQLAAAGSAAQDMPLADTLERFADRAEGLAKRAERAFGGQ